MNDIPQKVIATPTTHYGSPRASTWNFIIQRVSGGLNVVFTLFFIWLVVRLAHADAGTMGDLLANPVVAVVVALMVISVAVHMRIGMVDIIEDYITLAALVKLVLWG